MSVEREITIAMVDEELERARPLAESQGWTLKKLDDITLRASVVAPSHGEDKPEEFIFEFTFDDYPCMPPLIDVVHPHTGVRNEPTCFPKGTCCGYFHENKRICADWSRRAYKEFAGPHPEWEYGDWRARSGNVREIGMFLHELRRALYDSSYEGRIA